MSSGCYRDVDLIESLNHKKLSQFLSPILSQSYRQRQSHDLADNLLLLVLANCWKWAVLLVIDTVPTIKLLETVRVAGASELLEMGSFAGKLQVLAIKVPETVRVAGDSELLEMGSVAGNLQGFSHRNAGNCQGCWS